MVMVTLHLPPRGREPLQYVAYDEPSKVVVHTVFKYLVVKEIVSEPTTLLPEKS